MSMLLKNNILGYLTLKYNDYATKHLNKHTDKKYVIKTIHEFIVVSPDLRADIDYNYATFNKIVDKDLNGKTLQKVQKHMQEENLLPGNFIPECILLCSGVIAYQEDDITSVALNILPFCNLDFIDYINKFVKHIISGTYIPYSKDIFTVTNDNLIHYINAIFASYLYIYPDKIVQDIENVNHEDLIERISESIRTFLHYFQKMDNSEMFINYVQAFIIDIQCNELINDHSKDYLISSN